jgi:hypothetical protein
MLAERNPMHDWDVYLSAFNVPEKMRVTFTPAILDGFYKVTRANIELTVAADAVPGVYPITVRAAYEDGSWATLTVVTLIISALNGPSGVVLMSTTPPG